MKTEKVVLSTLKHPEKNARRHPEKQIIEFGKSLEMFGQTRPIVIDEKGTILIGNGMVMAMVAKGWEKADALRKKGLTQKQKAKLMLVDNKIYSLGVDDPEAQFALIEEIIGTGTNMDFEIPGFDEHVLQAFVSNEDDVDNNVSSYGAGIAPPEAGGKDTNTFLDGDGGGQTIETQAGESGGEPAGPQRTEGENLKQIRCPHCGELIWV